MRNFARLAVLGLVGVALAAGTAGSLDASFDSDGLVVTPPTGDWGTFLSVVVQADGKIVAAGVENTPRAFVVARYNIDGSLDDGGLLDSTPGDSFGIDGFVRPFGDDSSADSGASSVALDGTGRILVLGDANFERVTGKGKKTKIERVWTLALVRLLADGSLDESFDGDGKALVEMNIIQASALVLQAGKIVAVAPISVKNSGKGKAGRGSNYAMAIVRFHATGALDTSFGDGGIVVDNISGNDELPARVGLQSDNRIVVLGVDRTLDVGFLRRYETNGTIPTTLVTLSGPMHSLAIDIGGNDRILVAGAGGNGDGIVERYDADGALDTSFGNSTPLDGRYKTGLPGNDTLRSVFLLADGRIVACGETSGMASDGFVVRLNPNGTADSSFTGAVYGVSGISDPSDGINVVLDCAVDPNGNYVICGGKNGERTDSNGNPLGDFFLARYCGN